MLLETISHVKTVNSPNPPSLPPSPIFLG